MSRARKVGGAGNVTSPGVAAHVNGNSNAATPAPAIVSESHLSTGEVNRIDPKDGEIAQLRTALLEAQVAAKDANRLLAEVKAQRNAAMDEIMLLRAQLKVAIDDGNAGWAAASAAGGARQTH